jgi:hypothetical protein
VISYAAAGRVIGCSGPLIRYYAIKLGIPRTETTRGRYARSLNESDVDPIGAAIREARAVRHEGQA